MCFVFVLYIYIGKTLANLFFKIKCFKDQEQGTRSVQLQKDRHQNRTGSIVKNGTGLGPIRYTVGFDSNCDKIFTKMGQDHHQDGTGSSPKWDRIITKMRQDHHQNGTGSSPKWHRIITKMAQDRHQNGTGSSPKWDRILKHL